MKQIPDYKKILGKYLTFGLATILALIFFNAFVEGQTPILPDYRDDAYPSQWQNTITDTDGVQWSYRREITFNNPTNEEQTGTYTYPLKIYNDWYGNTKIFHVTKGIVKVVKQFENPDNRGAPLLREVPTLVTSCSKNEILVFFDYYVEADSIAKYFIYYGQSQADMDGSFMSTSKAGYASIGGYVKDIPAAGFSTQTGFPVISNNITATDNIIMYDESNYYFGELRNDFDDFPNYLLYVLPDGNERAIVTQNSIPTQDLLIRMVGDKNIPKGKVRIGLFDGSSEPSLEQHTGNPFIGVEMSPDGDGCGELENAIECNISDLIFHNSEFQTSEKWSNLYETPSDNTNSDGGYLPVDFIYEFIIDALGNLKFNLYEEGYNNELFHSVELGKIPWDSIYFQISSYETSFRMKSIVVMPKDVYQTAQNNGVKIIIGFEANLEYAKIIAVENIYTFYLVIITVIILFIHFFLRRFYGMDKIVDYYILMMIFLSIFITLRYHPLTYTIGIKNHLFYIDESEMGLELMMRAGEINPFFYYFMYSAFPFSITLWIQSKLVQPNSQINLALQRSRPRPQRLMRFFFRLFGIVIPLLMLFPLLIGGSILMNFSFGFLCIAIILALLNTAKQGLQDGKMMLTRGRSIKKFFAKWSFVYFVLKMMLEAYKAMNSQDPFIVIEPQGSFPEQVLGSLMPLIIEYWIRWEMPEIYLSLSLNILAILFSNLVFILIIGFTFLIETFKESGNIWIKIRTAIWMVYLGFAVDIVRFQFFTLIVAMLFVALWLLGNSRGRRLNFLRRKNIESWSV